MYTKRKALCFFYRPGNISIYTTVVIKFCPSLNNWLVFMAYFQTWSTRLINAASLDNNLHLVSFLYCEHPSLTVVISTICVLFRATALCVLSEGSKIVK